MENPWIIPAVAGLAILWLASLAAMRFWTRRQMMEDFMARPGRCELPRPNGQRLEDRAALEIIRSRRHRYLWNRWPETALSFYAIQEMSLEIMKEIAGVYYPQEEEPQLKASLADLLALHNRVGSRLAAWLETAPIRTFKDLELQSIIRYYGVYQNVRNHPVSRFIVHHRLHRLAQWSWAAFNYNNPFYWGRRGAYELARRLLLARIVQLVGEEAMVLYGRRG
ncbi:MAG: hypothetical protein ABSA09_02470 [Desulfobaccales bacterium]